MEKKEYNAFEAAKAVLAKYSELLAKSEHKEEHCEKCDKKECECEDKKVEKCGEIEKKEEDPNVKEYTHKLPASHGKNMPSGKEKGVHHTVDSKGRAMSTSAGRSTAGSNVRSANASKQGKLFYGDTTNKAPKEHSKAYNEKAKQEHKKVLGELKAMPKPNLPKSEMAKCGEPKKLKKFMEWRNEKKNK